MFVIGWLWLTIWSLAAGFAPNAICFDIFRALSGIGPSILMPNAAALLANGWKEQWKKNMAFAIFGAIAPGGYIIGAAVAAAIMERGGTWEWIYWSMAIVGALYTLASWLVIPDGGGMNMFGSGGVDWLGSFFGVSGLILIFVSLK